MNEQLLREMLQDLSRHNGTREKLLPLYLQKRMDLSLKNYYEELMQTYEELTKRDAARVLKKMFSKES